MKRYIKSAKDFPHALADVCEQNGWLGTSDASLSYHDIYDVIKDISI